MYDAVNDSRTRPQHLEWDGLVLPVDHPFWQTHGSPNELGWRPFGLTQAPAQDPTPHPRRKVKRGFPTPTNSRELSLIPAPSHEIPRVLWAADEGQ